MTKPIICILTATFMAVISVGSWAGTTTYTDRATWLSAIGGSSDFLVDFNGYTVDTPLVGTMDLGPFSVQSDLGRNIDVFPYANNDSVYGNGTPNLSLFVDGNSGTATLDFYSPIMSLFADFWNAGNGAQLQYSLYGLDGSIIDTLNIPGTGSTATFFGFISDIAISSIVLSHPYNDGFNMDSIEGGYGYASAITPPNAVPIPAAAFMFAPALLGFMGLRRRAKNKAV